MATYYRFQNDAPKVGEIVHCYTSRVDFINFVQMMRRQDPDFKMMKFWEIEGQLIRPDEDDVVVRVTSVKPILLSLYSA